MTASKLASNQTEKVFLGKTFFYLFFGKTFCISEGDVNAAFKRRLNFILPFIKKYITLILFLGSYVVLSNLHSIT